MSEHYFCWDEPSSRMNVQIRPWKQKEEMMKFYNIKKRVRSIVVKNFIYPAVVLWLTTFVYYAVPFQEVWHPVKMEDPLELTELYEDGVDYIQIIADTLYYTGYDYAENGSIKGAYYYNIYNGTCIIYLLSMDQTNGKAEQLSHVFIQAHINPMGAVSQDLLSHMTGDIGWLEDGLEQMTLPFIIDQTDYDLVKFILLFVLNTIVAIMSLIICGYYILCMWKPLCYASCLKLRRYGQLSSQLEQLEEELASSMESFGHIQVTNHFLLEQSVLTFQIIPLKQIICVIQSCNYHKFYLFDKKLTYQLWIIGKKQVSIKSYTQNKLDVEELLFCLNNLNLGIQIRC